MVGLHRTEERRDQLGVACLVSRDRGTASRGDGDRNAMPERARIVIAVAEREPRDRLGSGRAASQVTRATVFPAPGGAETVSACSTRRRRAALQTWPVDDVPPEPGPKEADRRRENVQLILGRLQNERGTGPRHPAHTVPPGSG